MQKIKKNLFELSPAEIDYKISILTESHREILLHLTRGKSDAEIAPILNITISTLRMRIASACDRAGVDRRAQLISMFAIYEYRREKTR